MITIPLIIHPLLVGPFIRILGIPVVRSLELTFNVTEGELVLEYGTTAGLPGDGLRFSITREGLVRIVYRYRLLFSDQLDWIEGIASSCRVLIHNSHLSIILRDRAIVQHLTLPEWQPAAT